MSVNIEKFCLFLLQPKITLPLCIQLMTLNEIITCFPKSMYTEHTLIFFRLVDYIIRKLAKDYTHQQTRILYQSYLNFSGNINKKNKNKGHIGSKLFTGYMALYLS